MRKFKKNKTTLKVHIVQANQKAAVKNVKVEHEHTETSVSEFAVLTSQHPGNVLQPG